MSQIGLGTNKKIVDVYNMMRDGNLKLAPAFQRKLVWNSEHKEKFLDTVLSGLPFPEVHFADGNIDLEKKTSTTLVVDGQQRLSTLFEYIDGTHKEIYSSIQPFAILQPEQQTDFLDYSIVIRDLGRIDQTKIIEIFKRINSVNYALNAIEVQNALYQGAFISTAKEILNNSNIFRDTELFSDTDASRMKDLEYVLLLLATAEEQGYFPFAVKIEGLIKQFDDEYPHRNAMLSSFADIASLIEACNLPEDSFWKKRSSFFTLVMELWFLNESTGKLPTSQNLTVLLVEFEDRVRARRKNDPEVDLLAAYYKYVYQNTGSKKARITRSDAFSPELAKLI